MHITPEHYAEAEKNGISAQNLYQRVRTYGWSINRALTDNGCHIRDAWLRNKELAESNGISEKLFKSRMYQNYTEEFSATKPPKKRRRRDSEGILRE